ncbi:type IV pilin [Thiohalobacter sp. COW1]|uniref:GspH/FimT family pseudopilin n=1 Tax=Thiohalobacter sp. COW1 TaxID=2795687 RepID=UPI0019169112|nr:GspH/FimT family pseudopilin [Thiohalobacter sp. COW1]BCO31640.1 type IV pilin [Thiohalobacter sp. COW1]
MKSAHGFTLIELMITLALAAIILTLGVPSFTETIRTNRVATQVNELVTALNLARSEAIKRATAVTVCASADQATCSGSNDWRTGWIVVTDDNTNTTGSPSENTVVRVWGALKGVANDDWGADYVRYQSTGITNVSTTLTHEISGCSGNQAREIEINAAGRIDVTEMSC